MAEASPSLPSDQILFTETLPLTFREEMFQENLQEQRDEILALQAIFNTEGDEKLKILSEVSDDNEGVFTLLITVCPKPISDAIQVELALPAGQNDNLASANTLCPPMFGPKMQLKRSTSGWHWQGSFSVKYLSPLYLQATLPPSYPSQDPPQFLLSCDWLTSDQLTSLTHVMGTLWSEGCQMPIIYTWVDWLENGIVSHLGITDHLVLQPIIPQVGEDETNAVSWVDNVGEIIACLIRYNQEQMDIEFCKNLQECHVCYSEKPGEQFFRLHECKHHYCHECMVEFCEMHVREGTVEALRCPDRECKALIPPYIVKAVMEPKAYQRWEQLLLQKTLDAMLDTVYCPRCTSLVIAEAEEELHLARCPVCYFAFCTECERGWHQGSNCVTDEEVLENIQAQADTVMTTAEEKKYQELLRRIEIQIEDAKRIKLVTKRCPKCRIPIEKMYGCNKMTCKCGQIFCWLCGKEIEGYDHFSADGCVLNTVPELPPAVVNVVRRPAEGLLRIRARIAVNPELAKKRVHCPTCKQVNIKGMDHNNHIKCWNCKSNFCFLCKQRIVTSSVMTHFRGPCLQHS